MNFVAFLAPDGSSMPISTSTVNFFFFADLDLDDDSSSSPYKFPNLLCVRDPDRDGALLDAADDARDAGFGSACYVGGF